MDIENFKGMPKYFGGNKKADNKINTTIKAVQYFNDKGLYDSVEICKASKKYFQDLAEKAYKNGKYLLAYNYYYELCHNLLNLIEIYLFYILVFYLKHNSSILISSIDFCIL